MARVDVCAVARRHGLTPAQLFTWRRLARRARFPARAPGFVPAVVEAAPGPPLPPSSRSAPATCACMGIELEMDGIGFGSDRGRTAGDSGVICALKVGS